MIFGLTKHHYETKYRLTASSHELATIVANKETGSEEQRIIP